MHQSMGSVPILSSLGIFLEESLCYIVRVQLEKEKPEKGKKKKRSHSMYFKQKRIEYRKLGTYEPQKGLDKVRSRG